MGWCSSFPSVDRFLKHYGRATRSEHTRKNILIVLNQFCRSVDLGPEELVSLSSGATSEKLQAYLDGMRDEGASVRTLNVTLGYLKVFFGLNGFKDNRELEVKRYHQPARYRKKREYIPTRDEILRMSYADGTKMGRALVLAAYTSGLRNSTLRALRYRDLREELVKGLEVTKVSVYPEMKEVDSGACKGNIPYYTFLAKETVNAIKDYLPERIKEYGDITEDEPLFCSTSSNYPMELRRRTPIKIRTLEVLVSRAARKAGIAEWRWVTPRGLRKAFESALRNSGLDTKDQEFLMGHILPWSQDTYYDESKAEELRAKYARVRFFETGGLNKVEIIKSFVKSLGIENLDVKIAKLRRAESSLSEEEAIGRIIRKEFVQPIRIEMTKRRDSDEDPQMIVGEEELESCLREGWQFVSVLPSQKILIRR